LSPSTWGARRSRCGSTGVVPARRRRAWWRCFPGRSWVRSPITSWPRTERVPCGTRAAIRRWRGPTCLQHGPPSEHERRRAVMAEPLSVERVRDALQALPEWELAHDRIRRSYRFVDFSQAFAFMTRVALLAEKQGHHPELRNVYSRV